MELFSTFLCTLTSTHHRGKSLISTILNHNYCFQSTQRFRRNLERRHKENSNKKLGCRPSPCFTMVLLFPAARSLNHLARFAPRVARPRNGTAIQTRGMALGGHHGPPPEWTGVDKVVRGYFPHDYQRTYRTPKFQIPPLSRTNVPFSFYAFQWPLPFSRRTEASP